MKIDAETIRKALNREIVMPYSEPDPKTGRKIDITIDPLEFNEFRIAADKGFHNLISKVEGVSAIISAQNKSGEEYIIKIDRRYDEAIVLSNIVNLIKEKTRRS